MIDWLVDLIDRSYDRPAWHGPNLKGSIRRVTAEQALRRSHLGRKTIAEQVAHAAYWKYAVRRMLRNDPRGTFALEGSNWFEVESVEWKSLVVLLETEHRRLREAVAAFPPARLNDPSPKKKYRCVDIITGVAMHDVYHAGQIQLIRRLLES